MRACCGRIARPRTSDGAAASYAGIAQWEIPIHSSHRRFLFPGAEGSPAERRHPLFPIEVPTFNPPSLLSAPRMQK